MSNHHKSFAQKKHETKHLESDSTAKKRSVYIICPFATIQLVMLTTVLIIVFIRTLLPLWTPEIHCYPVFVIFPI